MEIRLQLFWCPILPLKISQKNCPSRQAAISEKSGEYINLYPKSGPSERACMCSAPQLADETIGE